MLLAIDVGNTHVVIGLIENGEILHIERLTSNTKDTGAEYAIKLRQIFEFEDVDYKSFEGVIISSAVPPLTETLKIAVKRLTGIDSIVVSSGLRTGMNIRIDDPSTLGADLAVGGVAAIAYYSVPAIIVDLGTASTLFAVDGKKNFIGGAIIPGVGLSYSALSAGTSLLPAISITPPKKAISTNTVDCMRSGAVFGTAAMIDGMIERMEAEIGEKCTVVATGGLASSIIPYCKRDDIICDNDLLLKGLWYLFRKNKKAK